MRGLGPWIDSATGHRVCVCLCALGGSCHKGILGSGHQLCFAEASISRLLSLARPAAERLRQTGGGKAEEWTLPTPAAANLRYEPKEGPGQGDLDPCARAHGWLDWMVGRRVSSPPAREPSPHRAGASERPMGGGGRRGQAYHGRMGRPSAHCVGAPLS